MKRLRKHFKNDRIRYYACGEYGSKMDRPHYHACLFGVDFNDKELWSIRDDVKLYRSNTLEKIWTKGFSTIGDVNFQSAGYIARYCTKKITGDQAKHHYKGNDPEWALMSRRPGIGRNWYEKYKGDCYPKDFMTLNGKKLKPPKYYDYLYDIEYPDKMEEIKTNRTIKRKRNKELNNLQILQQMETVKIKQSQQLKRGIENEP